MKSLKSIYRCFFLLHRNMYFVQCFVLCCVVLSMQCAYLNTFYNAKIAFKNAYRAHDKFIQTNTDTSITMPADVEAGYERAIVKSKKVLDVYPKKKRWHDDAAFLIGKAQYYKQQYSSAIRSLRQFQREYPQSPYEPESYLLLAKAYLGNGNLEKTEETLLFILKTYPELNAQEEITLLQAEVAIKREGKSQAITFLENSLKSITNDEKRLDIILKLSRLYMDLRLYEKAENHLLHAPKNKDFPHLLYQIDFNLLICYKETQRYKKAMSLAEKMLDNKHYGAFRYSILFEKGMLSKHMSEFDAARLCFEDIVADTVTHELKAKAFLELGLLYQHHYADFQKAKEYYQQALNLSADEDVRKLAEQRIQGIEQRVLYNDSIEALSASYSPEQSNEYHYKLAEVYWIKLDEVDSALHHFRRIVSNDSSDTAITLKSMYAQAWILRFLKKDTTTADSVYSLIVQKAPSSLIAKRAQKDMDVAVTVMTREDSAHSEFVDAERLYFDKQDAVAAVNAYYKVAKTYADIDDIAINSLYAAAWLCDNVLQKNKKAFALYKMLCDKYPQSDICVQQALPRIRIVEDTLHALRSSSQKSTKNKNASSQNKIKSTTKESVTEEDFTIEPENEKIDTLTEENMIE